MKRSSYRKIKLRAVIRCPYFRTHPDGTRPTALSIFTSTTQHSSSITSREVSQTDFLAAAWQYISNHLSLWLVLDLDIALLDSVLHEEVSDVDVT